MRLNIFINAHLLARYISMLYTLHPLTQKSKILDVPMNLTAQNEQDDGHSISTKRSRRCRYILFILRLSTEAVVVSTIKHSTGRGR